MNWYFDSMPTTFTLLLILAGVLFVLDLFLAMTQYVFEDLMDKLDGMTLFQIAVPIYDYDPFSISDILWYGLCGGFFYIIAACVLTIFWPVVLPILVIWGIVYFITSRR